MISDSYQAQGAESFSSLLAGAAAKHSYAGERSQLAPGDLESILIFADGALELFRKNEGRLNAVEIRLRSMLAVVRAQVADELARAKGDEAA